MKQTAILIDNGSDHHYGHAINIAIEALKAVFFLNGGAATALVALTGKGSGQPDYGIAIILFGAGVWFAAVPGTPVPGTQY